MKISLALAGAVMLVSSLAACGGDDGGGGDGEGSDYCKDIKAASKSFGSLSSGDAGQLDKAFATFHDLADEAPSSIKSDWKTLDDAITTIETALKEAGLKFSDLPKLQTGQLPEGVDTAKLQALATELQSLTGSEFTKATKAIDTHASKTCKVNLNAS